MKLLIKFPTRNRFSKFFQVLDLYYNNLNNIENVEFCISMDESDESVTDEILDKLDTYQNLYYYINDTDNKIAAINANLEDFNFDVVLLASDDMIPQIKGYDDIILENMEKYYPDTDGVLWFFDGNRKDLNTLCILGKKYYDRFGYIYFKNYRSFYCDNEFMQVANKLKKQTYIDQCIIKHEHPDIPQFRGNFDALYDRNNKWYPHDSQLFMMRQKNNFGLK